jgi:hypothetical protein
MQSVHITTNVVSSNPLRRGVLTFKVTLKNLVFDFFQIWLCVFIRVSCFSYWIYLVKCLDTTFCDKVCQWPRVGQWFSLGTPVSSANETDSHDIN